jgi:hypothetical protein
MDHFQEAFSFLWIRKLGFLHSFFFFLDNKTFVLLDGEENYILLDKVLEEKKGPFFQIMDNRRNSTLNFFYNFPLKISLILQIFLAMFFRNLNFPPKNGIFQG